MKKKFFKEIDSKIARAAYPKVFRQVWPVIPIYDRTILGNYGLESVCHHMVSNSNDARDNTVDKVKAICHQCKYHFASAWQIRKCNSKQLLFCAACDLQNRKLLNRYHFDTHLKGVMEGIK